MGAQSVYDHLEIQMARMKENPDLGSRAAWWLSAYVIRYQSGRYPSRFPRTATRIASYWSRHRYGALRLEMTQAFPLV